MVSRPAVKRCAKSSSAYKAGKSPPMGYRLGSSTEVMTRSLGVGGKRPKNRAPRLSVRRQSPAARRPDRPEPQHLTDQPNAVAPLQHREHLAVLHRPAERPTRAITPAPQRI